MKPEPVPRGTEKTLRGQIATRRDGALGGFARTEPGLDGGQELPEQPECGNASSDEEPPPDELIQNWGLWVRIGVSHEGGFLYSNQLNQRDHDHDRDDTRKRGANALLQESSAATGSSSRQGHGGQSLCA